MSSPTKPSHFASWRSRLSSHTRPKNESCVFVFSGGGLNGAAQAGMVRELLNAGVFPDAIIGVSVGALNGVFLAGTERHRAGEALVDAWLDVAQRGIFDASSPKRLWAIMRQRPSLDDASRLTEVLKSHCPVSDLSQCHVPVRVGTLDLASAQMVWWDRGPALERLLASTAIPGVFPPVTIDARVHVDGAVASPVPISAAVEFEPTRIIVFDVAMMDDPPETSSNEENRLSALGVLLSSFEAVRRRLADAERHSVSDDVEIHIIRAGLPGSTLPETLPKIPELIELGAKAAKELLRTHPELTARQDD